MASVSKMSTTNAPEAVPAAESAFFKVLPPEIRLNIYKKAFQGARVDARLTMEDDPFGGGGKQHLVRFRHSSKHFNLLRTCRKIYDEALPTYWSEAVLNLMQPPFIVGDPEKSFQWAKEVKVAAGDYSYNLCNSLPEVVKANVKHVRGMKLPPLHGRFLKKNPELTPTAMLSNFKSLATCDISPTIVSNPEVPRIRTDIRYPRNITSIQHDSEINTEGSAESNPTDSLPGKRGRFKTILEKVWNEPKELVRKICGIDATGEVVFLAKESIRVGTFELVATPPEFQTALTASTPGHSDRVPDMPENILIRFQTLHQFWNLSAGTFYEADAEKVADEEGYDVVIRGGPEFEPAGGQTC